MKSIFVKKVAPLVIAIDFDGTSMTHDYPALGSDIGAFEVYKELVDNNHKLILNTMRSGGRLELAVDLFKKNNIPLYGINSDPTQAEWTSSPKCHADLYIDDRALGIPLIYDRHVRPYVDWVAVREMLVERGII